MLHFIECSQSNNYETSSNKLLDTNTLFKDFSSEQFNITFSRERERERERDSFSVKNSLFKSMNQMLVEADLKLCAINLRHNRLGDTNPEYRIFVSMETRKFSIIKAIESQRVFVKLF